VGIFIFLAAWILLMTYVIVGGFLYVTKVLPALSRDGLDACPKLWLSSQLAQVDLFLSRLPPNTPRPWYYGVLSRARLISTAVLSVELVALMAWVAFLSL
jgi:hypothetical protein